MYKKIIKSGSLVEIYEYEKDPPEFRKRRKSRSKNTRRFHRSVSRARASFFRLVRSNVSSARRPAFLTFTMREIVTLKEGWKEFTKFANRWKLRRKRLQEGGIEFVVVPEFQERGAVHFHCLIWGLSDEEIAFERTTRRIAECWGHGFIDLRQSDGSPKIASYLTKYMFKAMYDDRLVGRKSYSASRGLVRSVPIRSKAAHALIEGEINGDLINYDGSISQGVDNPIAPDTERVYNTRWLGKCVYKAYNLE